MALDLLADERDPGLPDTDEVGPTRRFRWFVGLAVFAVFAAGLGYVTGNEVQANTQFDQTHHSLDTTRHHIAIVLGDLAVVRHGLRIIDGQITAGSVALAQDTSELKAVQTALVNAQANVSHQTVTIGNLQTCLGGVEQALNALAVADQNQAISALNSVTTSCASVVASGG